MLNFKPSKLTLALLSSGVIAMSAPSFAAEKVQDKQAKEQEVEVITVTGLRGSLIKSINTKRFSAEVVEAISAEDIGKLPDSSIAESIARLPGLTAQRLDGRASKVSIRGFGENESATTLNGREQVSIGDNRGVEFDLYPSEIMSGVTVYKTPNATLEAEGIAGVVDMQTVRPLGQESRLQINGQYEKTSFGKLNPDGDDSGFRSTISYIDSFADDTVGLAIAATTMSSPNQEKRWNSWGYNSTQQVADWGGSIDGGSYGLDTKSQVLGGAKPFARSSTLKRDSVMAVLELQPSDKLNIIADALYVDFTDEKILRGIEIPGVWAGGSTVVNKIENDLVTDATITNRAVVRNDNETRDAQLKSFGLNVQYDVTDDLKVEFDASHSSVKRQIWSMEVYAGTGRGDNNGVTDSINYQLQAGGTGATFNPSLDYSDYDLIKLGGPLSWGNGNSVPSDAQDGFINAPEIDGALTTLKLAATQAVDLGIITELQYGVSYKDRDKTKKSEGYYLTLKDYPADLSPVPEQYRLGTTNLDFIGMGDMIAFDSSAMVADGYYNLTAESLTDKKHLGKSWTVTEKVTAAFVQAGFEFEIAGMPVTGNAGVRYLKTKQNSTGFGSFTDTNGDLKYVPTDVSHDFSALLPSLNMTLALDDNQYLRFGAGKTLSRPRMDEMNSSVSVSYDKNSTSGFYWNVDGGNPTLEPKEAIGLDLTYENYFHAEGYFAIALYHKELKEWIFDGKTVLDFSNVPTPDGSPALGNLAIANGKVNGGDGSLTGYEISVTFPLMIIDESLEGFGLVASYAGVTSDIQDQNGDDYELPGLSDAIQSLTAYYERDGLQTRVSMRKRSSFKGDIYAIGFDTEQHDIAGETIIDAQIGYDFGEAGHKSLEGLSIFLQGQNLTNEPFTTYNNGAVRDYQDYGSTYLLGFSYKL